MFKNLLLTLCLLTGACFAQTCDSSGVPTILPNSLLLAPAVNQCYWGTPLIQDMGIIETWVSPGGPTLPNLHVGNFQVDSCTGSGCSNGTVTGVTAGNLSNLFTSSVAGGTTPSITFSPVTFPAHTFYGNNTGSTGNPGQVGIAKTDLPFTYTGATTLLVTAGAQGGGTGAIECKASDGSITTTGCSTAGGSAVVLSPGSGVNQAIAQASGTNFRINRFEGFKFADGFNSGSSTGGIQEAINDCGSGQCIVFLPVGTTNACGVTIPDNVHFMGFGTGSSVLNCGVANQPVIASTGDQVEIDHMTVQHSVLPTCADSSHCGDGISTGAVSSDRMFFHHLEVKNNWNNLRLHKATFAVVSDIRSEFCEGDGVLFDNTIGIGQNVMQWHLTGSGLVEQCAGWGIDLNTASLTTAPNIYGWDVYGNQAGGIRMKGSSSTNRVSDVYIDGATLSTNNGDNILVDAYGRNVQIINGLNELAGQYFGTYGYANSHCVNSDGSSGCVKNLQTGNGITITANCDPTGPAIITGGKFWEESNNAVSTSCTGTLISNSFSFDAGYAGPGTNTGSAGFAIKASLVSVTNSWCGSGNGKMLTCIDISNSADKPSLIGNILGNGVSNMVTTTTTPTNGFREWLGNTLYIQSNLGASGSCSTVPNGSTWIQTGGSGGMWVCQNGTWAAH